MIAVSVYCLLFLQTIYAALTEAEAAGFRACLRCCPQYGAKNNSQGEMVEKICRLIEENLNETLSLAANFEISPSHLQRTFKTAVGISPREYALSRRVSKFKANVKENGDV